MMRTMPFQQATLLLFVLLQAVSVSSRALQSRWDITGPTFDYENYEINMDYLISEEVGDGEAWYSLFDGDECQEGANSLERNSDFIKSQLVVRSASGNKGAKISVVINPQEIQNSPIYGGKSDKEAEIVFCVRFGLYTGNHDNAGSMEVNFLETPVHVKLALSAGSNITVGEIVKS